ncbi:TadA family conjugal transfer-associated ATPase [Gulosibacter molinativorax]|uniref:Type II/type IV pathway secretion protein n=1 Tax=Gulosibacter molinativorax TaxID=256821 RepID=A0ABT7CBA7_9MICO|nr:TadA family conjugal transfer-associated ATPase [Gulosibacter molinativorax]MDJ1372373.1 type II/type IV pathway secretion protein [Gulosibacter molinativorax]QUY63538.1 Pilus assembly protein CpaF [Gulosibacter molinativorax]
MYTEEASRTGTGTRERFVVRPTSERPAAVDLVPIPGRDDSRRQRRELTRGEAEAFGPLAGFIADGEVTDIFVNGMAGLWVDRGNGLEQDRSWRAPGERALRELAVRIIAAGGRHIDEASPAVDVRIGDGIRAHAVLPPISTSGTLLSIRAPRTMRITFEELRTAGFFYPGADEVVRRALTDRANLLITGAGGSGKTTLLGALLGEAARDERLVVIEDVAELRIAHPHVVSLEARQANVEGAGEVPLARLVRESLRMRPDRLVLGECRGAELRELLAALNTGHDGGAGTLHANSLNDVPARLEALGALADMSAGAIARQTVSAIDLVMHVERHKGVRQLVDMGEFWLDDAGRLRITSVRSGTKLERA